MMHDGTSAGMMLGMGMLILVELLLAAAALLKYLRTNGGAVK